MSNKTSELEDFFEEIVKQDKKEFVCSLDDSTVESIIIALNGGDVVLTDSLMNSVKSALYHISQREKDVLLFKYGTQKLPFSEIGRIFGLPSKRITEMKQKAFTKIRRILRNDSIKILTYNTLLDMEIKGTEYVADKTAKYYYELGYKQALKDIGEYVSHE